jgi:hypothetical protein
VGVGGADEHRVDLAGEVHVAVKASLPPQQPDVLEPLDGLTDSELAHQETAGHRTGMVAAAYHKLVLRRLGGPLLE